MRAPRVGGRVIEAFKELDKIPIICCQKREGDYVEEDENGVVIFYRKSGHAFMMMNKTDYEEMLEYAEKKDDRDLFDRV